jgi:hypothetical protein
MYKVISFILPCLLLLTACNPEEKIYYSTLGIIVIKQDSTIIEADDGSRFLVENRNSISPAIQDSDRVIASFTIIDGTLPEGIDLIIEIYSIEKVLFKPVIELTSLVADSIGNDPLLVGSLWLEKDFINLSFSYYGYTQIHYINLIRYPGEIPIDTIDLEIRHNNNNDEPRYIYSGFVTFDLRSLQNDVADSVVLRIKAKEYDNHSFEQNFTYRY